MAWERRARGGIYYTRSRRENGRVVREYIGGGEFGELLAEFDAADQMQARIRQAREQAEREHLAVLDAEIAVVDALADALLRRTLTEAGYRQHNRGEWRKKRNGGTNKESGANKTGTDRRDADRAEPGGTTGSPGTGIERCPDEAAARDNAGRNPGRA